MKLLAVETSCDETAVALLEFVEHDNATLYRVLGEKLYSQIALHAQYGGVYPSLAKREHQKILPLLTKELLDEHLVLQKNLLVRMNDVVRDICVREPIMFAALENYFIGKRPKDLDALAVTQGPGLAPALWVGVNFVRALSLLWNIPLIPVNHMEGHIISALITDTELITPRYPLLALLVSGGHTELVFVHKPGVYEKIGRTLDDAAGEAFDKVARLLGLPYPGGPEIAKLAHIARTKKIISPVKLPRPMLQDTSYDFSYAGLKTAVRVACEKNPNFSNIEKSGLAMEFEDAVVETLSEKTRRAIERYAPKSVVVSGGVSANVHLRSVITALIAMYPDIKLYAPHSKYATDNAFMVALTGYINRHAVTDAEHLSADAHLSFPYKKFAA